MGIGLGRPHGTFDLGTVCNRVAAQPGTQGEGQVYFLGGSNHGLELLAAIGANAVGDQFQ